MKTEKVYYSDVNCRMASAKVLEILPCKDNSDSILLVLDRTIFFPTGGGQSCDLGEISGLKVTDVTESGEVIFHKISLVSVITVNKIIVFST